MTPLELWGMISSCFSEDDGSLPTVEIVNLTADELQKLYAQIRGTSRVVSDHATFWDNGTNAERQLDDVPNAGALVSSGRAAPFHFAVEGVTVGAITLPCLGVHVFQESIAFDYRMGPAWSAERVYAFFSWLKALVSFTDSGFLRPSATEAPPDPAVFGEAWRLFVSTTE